MSENITNQKINKKIKQEAGKFEKFKKIRKAKEIKIVLNRKTVLVFLC